MILSPFGFLLIQCSTVVCERLVVLSLQLSEAEGDVACAIDPGAAEEDLGRRRRPSLRQIVSKVDR